jgi:hypothetical protein
MQQLVHRWKQLVLKSGAISDDEGLGLSLRIPYAVLQRIQPHSPVQSLCSQPKKVGVRDVPVQ